MRIISFYRIYIDPYSQCPREPLRPHDHEPAGDGFCFYFFLRRRCRLLTVRRHILQYTYTLILAKCAHAICLPDLHTMQDTFLKSSKGRNGDNKIQILYYIYSFFYHTKASSATLAIGQTVYYTLKIGFVRQS